MKKATLQINFDSEKLTALKQYMVKKEASIETELDDVVQKLYEKYVPAPVREYIESRPQEPENMSRRPSKPSAGSENKNTTE